ncbi:MAG TPA: glycosyltransferase family 10 [Verrucomicrobiae bacterium]|nr:glycosyltransferase family 10 [Verrucomicrobiae bacterium]
MVLNQSANPDAKRIRLNFSNFWPDFTPQEFLCGFPYLLKHYEFVLDSNPDFVFYSVFGRAKKINRHAQRILFCGESGDPFRTGSPLGWRFAVPGSFHWGLTMAVENDDPRHIYFPLMCLHHYHHNDGLNSLIRKSGELCGPKEFFCNFIYSNAKAQRRIEFFKKLSHYKRVEAPANVEQNRPPLPKANERGGYLEKQRFQSRCKFTMAFENAAYPGYTTEKLSDAFVARSVPIYWGNPRVEEIFNPDSFINVNQFKSDEEAIEFIRAVDEDDQLYQKIWSAPPFRDNVIPRQFADGTYLSFFKRIFDQKPSRLGRIFDRIMPRH